jgi:hypothetical protein
VGSRVVRAKLYRNTAGKALLLVETMKDPGSRAMLLSVAQNFFALAAMLDKADRAGEDLTDTSDLNP